jgi:hypothetical protein
MCRELDGRLLDGTFAYVRLATRKACRLIDDRTIAVGHVAALLSDVASWDLLTWTRRKSAIS